MEARVRKSKGGIAFRKRNDVTYTLDGDLEVWSSDASGIYLTAGSFGRIISGGVLRGPCRSSSSESNLVHAQIFRDIPQRAS